ncbi:hypothetical protein CIPAW_07G169100 [Carya illinoinensis]|uniref:Uncharacterized protein n=1 Tax=Carya illinoinensis TaxID=32201 RepID=A0A8T1PX19_CARIL|nr:hypothetical protein CIPAW_07G169100 [Carya illinoinensis]
MLSCPKTNDKKKKTLALVHLFYRSTNGSTRKKAEALLPITYSIAQSDPTLMISLLFTILPERIPTNKAEKISIIIMSERERERRERDERESHWWTWLLYNASAGVVTSHQTIGPTPPTYINV